MKLETFHAFKHMESAEGTVMLTPKQLSRLHQILLEMMDDLVEICESEGICYFLGGGSALGAVRHGGFIPWDDDLDVNMPRADFERFVPLFRERFGEKYWIQTPRDTKNFGLSLAKIRRKGTVLSGRDDFQSEECGVPIDIFIIENTFDNKLLRNLHGVVCLGMGFLLSCRKFFRDRRELMDLAEGVPSVRGVFRLKILIGTLLIFVPLIISICFLPPLL